MLLDSNDCPHWLISPIFGPVRTLATAVRQPDGHLHCRERLIPLVEALNQSCIPSIPQMRIFLEQQNGNVLECALRSDQESSATPSDTVSARGVAPRGV